MYPKSKMKTTEDRKKYYPKKATGNCGLHGVQYQIELITLFLIRGLKYSSSFAISTENDYAGKFDDLVLEAPEGDVLLQAKHKENTGHKITFDDLFSTNPKKDDFSVPKYFISYLEIRENFNTKHLVLSTNNDIKIDKDKRKWVERRKMLRDHLLFYSGQPEYYKFTDEIFPLLKIKAKEYISINKSSKPFFISDENMDLFLSDENMREFVEKLQFVCNYPHKKDMKFVIHEHITQLDELSKGLEVESTIDSITRKMEKWLQMEKGLYLTNLDVRSIFAEIRSLNFEEKLKSLDLSFHSNMLPPKQVLQIIPNKEPLLPLLKVYNYLKTDSNKILVIDPAHNIDIKLDIINAFELPKYTNLVITEMNYPKLILENINSKLKSILDTFKYKKIIIISNQNVLTLHLKEWDDNKYEQINFNLTFADLCEDIQLRLLDAKLLDLQGRKTNLRELLDDDLTTAKEIVDESVLMKLANKEEIKIGTNMEAEPPYYIPRELERGSSTNCSEIHLACPPSDTGNIMVISDSPGSGKSTVLKKVASTIIDKYPNIWIIRVDLNTYTNILYEYKQKHRSCIELHDLLNSKSSTQLRSQFENKLLYGVRKKIILLIDGVDEVIPDYTQLVFNFISKCAISSNISKIIITCRTYVQNDLEKAFNVESFRLKPLSYEQQVDFLVKFWSNNLKIQNVDTIKRIEEYARMLLDKLFTINDPAYSRFLGIPLQIYMLAEIFESSNRIRKVIWHSCEDHITLSNTDVIFPERLNLSTLYDLFVDKKRDIYVTVTCKSEGNVEMIKYFNKQFDEYLQDHQDLARNIIFNEKSKYPAKDSQESLLKIGIIQKLSGKLVFIHKTFSEYFASKYLFENLKIQSDISWLNHALAIIPKDQTITVFFGELVECECMNIFENFGIDYKSANNNPNTPLLEKVSTLKMLQHKGLNKLHIAAMMNDLHTLEYLLQKGAEFNVTSYKKRTVWHYAAIHGNLNLMKFLLTNSCNLLARTDDGELASHIATYNGHLEALKFMLENGIEINDQNSNGESHLHIAALGGHLHIIKFIYDQHADINLVNINGECAYHMAAKSGNINILQYILDQGADVNKKTNNEETALHLAAKNNHLNVVDFLINFGIDIDTNDISLLETTVKYGHLDILTILVQKNCNVDMNTFMGLNILQTAIEYSQRHIVEYIIDYNKKNKLIRGALNIKVLPSYEDSVGVTNMIKCILERIEIDDYTLHKICICKIIRDGHYEAVKYTLDYCKNPLRLDIYICIAAHCGHLEILKYLEEKGARIDAYDENPYTLKTLTVLQHAASAGHFDIVEYLVDRGVLNSILFDEDGEKAFHLAALGGHFDIVSLLLSRGVNVNVFSEEGLSALHYAASRGSLSVVEFLINKGIDIDGIALQDSSRSYVKLMACISEIDEDEPVLRIIGTRDGTQFIKYWINRDLVDLGMSALHYAAYRGHLKVIQFLVRKGIDMYCLSKSNMTAVHFAACAGHLNIVEYLADQAVSLKLGNKDGVTALHLAAAGGNMNVVEYLLENNLPLEAVSHYRLSALHFAVLSGSIEVIKCLVQKGLSPHVQTELDWLPLHFAAREGFRDIIEYLMSKGSDRNAVTHDGMTVLHIASKNGNLQLVKYLVECKVDINKLTRNNMSALDLANIYEHEHIAEFLISSGAKIS